MREVRLFVLFAASAISRRVPVRLRVNAGRVEQSGCSMRSSAESDGRMYDIGYIHILKKMENAEVSKAYFWREG